MKRRTWIPADWMDESVPTCGTSPDDFLKRNANGVLQLMPIDPEEGSTWPAASDILPGQEVQFCWHEDGGTATLVLRDDGTWSLNPPFDGDVNCITDADGDAFAQDVDDYISQYKEIEPMEPGEYQLWGWFWSEPIAFRALVLESGAATFEEVKPDAP